MVARLTSTPRTRRSWIRIPSPEFRLFSYISFTYWTARLYYKARQVAPRFRACSAKKLWIRQCLLPWKSARGKFLSREMYSSLKGGRIWKSPSVSPNKDMRPCCVGDRARYNEALAAWQRYSTLSSGCEIRNGDCFAARLVYLALCPAALERIIEKRRFHCTPISCQTIRNIKCINRMNPVSWRHGISGNFP